jgi:hypothetical protein
MNAAPSTTGASAARHRYGVYGAVLDSAMKFPELRVAPDDAPTRWTFDTVPTLPAMRTPIALGDDHIYGAVHARFFQHAEGHRIQIDDTGTFDIAPDRRTLRWEERGDAWPDFVRSHLTGRVIATALYLDGLLPLHGSAVETAAGVIGFLAPKGYGKSTLALALTQAGGRLVTDDTLPIELPTSVGTPGALDVAADAAPRAVAQAWPGVHSVRLREDSMRAIGTVHPAVETNEGKQIITDIPGDRRTQQAAPLAALYLLDPVHPQGAEATWAPLPSMLAAISVVAHVKIGKMLGAAAAPVMLERAAAITRHVPVRRLQMPRDLTRLEAVARTILSWHETPA